MFIFKRKFTRKRKQTQPHFLHLLFISFVVFFPFNASSQKPCEDTRCKTGSCDDNGACICNLPDSSTILEGDRPFFGGRFCDEEQIMCDGTNSFWCEHGGSCVEIVQGENYTCNCSPGYAGEHCQHNGAPCGKIFCFHEAECLVEDKECGCRPDWRGSTDCSLATKTETDTSTDSTITWLPNAEGRNDAKWFVMALAVSCSTGVAVVCLIYAKRCFKKNTTVSKFQQLSQMQTNVFLEDDEEHDLLVTNDVHSNGAHL